MLMMLLIKYTGVIYKMETCQTRYEYQYYRCSICNEPEWLCKSCYLELEIKLQRLFDISL